MPDVFDISETRHKHQIEYLLLNVTIKTAQDPYALAEAAFKEMWHKLRERAPHMGVRIELRSWLPALLLVLCASQARAEGLHLDLTLDHGKAYNYLLGEWVQATTPGVEATFGGWSLAASVSTDRRSGGIFERAAFGSYAREFGRVTVSAGGSFYKYPGAGFDWTWSTGLRFRLR